MVFGARKSRSTEYGRKYAYEKFKEVSKNIPEMTDAEISSKIGLLCFFNVDPNNHSRKQLEWMLYCELAKQIVTA